MDSGHQSAFDKIFKMADTRRESSKMSITTFVGFFGKFSGVITLKACKEAKNVIVVGYQFHSTL
jgi:hypothetical protein